MRVSRYYDESLRTNKLGRTTGGKLGKRFATFFVCSRGATGACFMKECGSGEETIWPYYWTKDRNGRWPNGQLPSLLSIEEIQKVTEDFEQDCD